VKAALCVALGACAPSWQVPDGAVVADRGTFHYAGGTETFTVADRADGGHIIHDDLEITRFRRLFTSAGTLVLDAAWRPLEGTFSQRGVAVRLVRDHDKLSVVGLDGATVATDTTPSDIFYTAYTGAAFLEPLCAVRGRKEMSMFPDLAIVVDGQQQSDNETAAAAKAYHFEARDHVTLVSVTGGLAAELVCDGPSLVAVKLAGEVIVRPGYESLAQVMP
jgi:hypothetical protein